MRAGALTPYETLTLRFGEPMVNEYNTTQLLWTILPGVVRIYLVLRLLAALKLTCRC